MRVLFSGVPGTGHLLPMVPLARAFRDRGDTVAFTSAPGLDQVITSLGMEFLPAGARVEDAVARVRESIGVDMFAGPDVEGEAEFFAAARIDLGLDEVLAAARSFQPDLIVAEHYELLAPLVGGILGVPVAKLAYGIAMPTWHSDPMGERLRPRYEAHGLVHGPARWYLDTCPPALQNPDWTAPAGWIGLRPEAHRDAGWEPSAEPAPVRERPRVLVSFGTMFAKPEVVGPFLRELLEEDVDLRVTLNTSAPEDFALEPEQAARVEFVGFTPLAELLQDVDVILTHGGAGSMLAALSLGIPMVVVPQGAGQPVYAGRAEGAGAAIAFPLREAAPDAVATAVAKVLADPSFRFAAQRIADEIARYETPAVVAERLAAELGA